jgi:hypothetical protein
VEREHCLDNIEWPQQNADKLEEIISHHFPENGPGQAVFMTALHLNKIGVNLIDSYS